MVLPLSWPMRWSNWNTNHRLTVSKQGSKPLCYPAAILSSIWFNCSGKQWRWVNSKKKGKKERNEKWNPVWLHHNTTDTTSGGGTNSGCGSCCRNSSCAALGRRLPQETELEWRVGVWLLPLRGWGIGRDSLLRERSHTAYDWVQQGQVVIEHHNI